MECEPRQQPAPADERVPEDAPYAAGAQPVAVATAQPVATAAVGMPLPSLAAATIHPCATAGNQSASFSTYPPATAMLDPGSCTEFAPSDAEDLVVAQVRQKRASAGIAASRLGQGDGWGGDGAASAWSSALAVRVANATAGVTEFSRTDDLAGRVADAVAAGAEMPSHWHHVVQRQCQGGAAGARASANVRQRDMQQKQEQRNSGPRNGAQQQEDRLFQESDAQARARIGRASRNQSTENRKVALAKSAVSIQGETNAARLWELQKLYYESSSCVFTESIDALLRRPDDPARIEEVRRMISRYVLLEEEREEQLVAEYLEKLGPQCTSDACSSCGMRDMRDKDQRLRRVAVEDLPPHVFKVKPTPKATPELRSVDLRPLLSCYQLGDDLYHLHPELIVEGDDGRPSACLCAACSDQVAKKATASVPARSLAAGVDFGVLHRIEALRGWCPSEAEQLLLAEVRHYAVVLKVSTVGHSRATLEGHFITFLQDSWQKAAEGLDERINWLKGVMHVAFVGPKGKFDVLKHRLMKMPELRTDPRVIFNGLTLRAAVKRAFGNEVPPVPDFETCRRLVSGLDEHLVNTARVISDTAMEDHHVRASSDQTHVRDAPADPEDGPEKEPPPTLAHVAVLASEPALSQASASRLNAATNALQAGPTAQPDAPCEQQLVRVARAADPQSEFEDNGRTIMTMYPYLFPLAHEEPWLQKAQDGSEKPITVSLPLMSRGTLSDGDVRHLLLQYTNAFATCSTLIFLIANQKRRSAALRALNVRVSHRSFDDFEQYTNASDFKDKLSAASANPKGAEARELERKLLPLLAISARDVPWGRGERGAVVSKANAIERRYGPGDFFLTINPDDKHNPTCIRMGIAVSSNGAFPAVVGELLGALQEGADEFEGHSISESALHRQAAGNAVSSAMLFDRVIDTVLSVLLALAPAQKTRKTTPIRKRKKGIFGTTCAYIGTKEVTGKKALHGHFIVWANAMSTLLADLAAHPQLMQDLAKALDSLLVAELPFEVYLLDESRRTLHVPSRRPSFYPQLAPTSEGALFELQLDAARYNNHDHTHTCHLLPQGANWCRGCKPSGHPVPQTRIVQLRRRTPRCPPCLGEAESSTGVDTSTDARGTRQEAEKDPYARCKAGECDGSCGANGIPCLRAGCTCDPQWFLKSFGKEWPEGQIEVGKPEPAAPHAEHAAAEPAEQTQAIQLCGILSKRDKRALMCELKRPIVTVPAELPRIKEQLSASFDEIKLQPNDASELVDEALLHLRRALPQPMCEDAERICKALNDATPEERVKVVCGWRKLACRNGMFVELSRVLTACLQWNTAPYLLGTGEGARAAMYYIAKYVSKESVALSASLSVLVDVKDNIDMWPSRASDSGTARRTALHFGQRALTRVDVELADTQAAACGLAHLADVSSELFVWFDPKAFLMRAKQLAGFGVVEVSSEGEAEEADALMGRANSSDGSDVEIGHDLRHERVPDSHLRGAKKGASTSSGEVFLDKDRKKLVRTLVDHYRHSGEVLDDVSPYEYCMLISVEEQQKVAQRDEEQASQGRPLNARFPFNEVYALHERYIQVARSKIPCPRLVGGAPPKPPPRKEGGTASRTWLKSMREFAAYVVANFVPWEAENNGVRMPRELSIGELADWMRKLRRDAALPKVYLPPKPKAGRRPSKPLLLFQALLRQHLVLHEHTRHLAVVRLADLKNFFTTGRVDKEAKKLNGAYRNRNREWWPSDCQHGFAPPGESVEEEVRRQKRELEERAEARKVDPKRVNDCAAKEEWVEALVAHLPVVAAAPASAAAAGASVGRPSWRNKPPTALGVLPVASADDAARLAEALRNAPPSHDRSDDEVQSASEAHTAAVEDEPEEFKRLPSGELAELQAEWKRKHAVNYQADMPDTPPPPLNATQRTFGRRLYGVLCALREARLRGQPRAQAVAGLEMQHLLMGAAGTGKTEFFKALGRVLERQRMGRILFTSWLGVACTLLPGCATTVCSLLGIPGSAAGSDKLLGTPTQKHEGNFKLYAGSPNSIELVVVDEVSFLTTESVSHIDGRLRHFFDQPDLDFGGMPIVFGGDFWQLPCISGTSLFAALVMDALDVRTLSQLGIKQPNAGPLGAFATGVVLLKRFRRTVLTEQMRAAEDEAHAKTNEQMRDTKATQPVSARCLAALKPFTADDVVADPSWRFEPMVVLSHVERVGVNLAQARAFAAHHGLLLIRWKLPLVGTKAQLIDDAEEEQELYEREAATLCGWFVAGAPGIIEENIGVTCKLANGTHVTYHSLTLSEGLDLEEMMEALPDDATELELPEPPVSINVVPSSLKRADRRRLIRGGFAWTDPDSKEPVVPILMARKRAPVVLTSVWAATHGVPGTLYLQCHSVTLAFALTDFKWQGKTVRRLLISLAKRNFMPWLSLTSFYTMRTRTRRGDDQRTVGFDPGDAEQCARLRSLTHPAALRIWQAGYEHGRWSSKRAAAEAAVMLRAGKGKKRPAAVEPESSPEPEAEYHADTDESME